MSNNKDASVNESLSKKQSKYPWIIAVIVISCILFGDEVWISWRFNQLCKDAGVHVYQKVEVEGFYDDIHGSANDHIEKHGFRFAEGKSRTNGKIAHVEKVNGEWIVTLLDHPEARYIYKYSANNEDMGLQLEKWEVVVVDSRTGAILGRDTRYKKYPGWVTGLWDKLWGVHPTICEGSAPKPPELRHLLYHYVLIPANKN